MDNSNRETDRSVSSDLFHEERRRTEDRVEQLVQQVNRIEGRLCGFVSYKDLWGDWWKVVGILIGAVASGAGLMALGIKVAGS